MSVKQGWHNVSDTSSEHGSVSSDLFQSYSDLFDEQLRNIFGKNDPRPFFLGYIPNENELQSGMSRWLLNQFSKSFCQLEKKHFTLLKGVYLHEKCTKTTLIEQLRTALVQFAKLNTNLKVEPLHSLSVYQKPDGTSLILLGAPGYQPITNLTNGNKLILHLELNGVEYLESSYATNPLQEVARSFKKSDSNDIATVSTETQNTVMKHKEAAPASAWFRSETPRSELTETTTKSTELEPYLVPKSGNSENFEALLSSLKQANFNQEQLEKLQKVLDAKKTLL